MRHELNVIFTIDEIFVQHFSVTLISLLENNKNIEFKIFVIHDIKDLGLLNIVVEFVEKKYSASVKLLELDVQIFGSFRTSLHYSKVVYFRLLFTEILPKDIDKALFLDADVVVTNSIDELVQFDFKNESLLAVNDNDQEDHIQRLNKMGFPIKSYFNAGILLINLKYWRQHQVSKKLMNLANEFMESLSWWDQDILNMYFHDSWENMNPKYNALHLETELLNVPTIIHYAGKRKPWLYVCETPYKRLYWQYIKLTPFKNASYPDKNLKQVLIKKYYKVKRILFPNFKLPSAIKMAVDILKRN